MMGARSDPRVPPGQRVTRDWPVLHYGAVPEFDPATWDFRIFGLVEERVRREARFAMVHAEAGFETNLPLSGRAPSGYAASS